ncbi:hypothetical protein ACO0QE_004684 [Hanseniaspora vineae]
MKASFEHYRFTRDTLHKLSSNPSLDGVWCDVFWKNLKTRIIRGDYKFDPKASKVFTDDNDYFDLFNVGTNNQFFFREKCYNVLGYRAADEILISPHVDVIDSCDGIQEGCEIIWYGKVLRRIKSTNNHNLKFQYLSKRVIMDRVSISEQKSNDG